MQTKWARSLLLLLCLFFHLSPSKHHSFTWTSLIAIPHSSTLCSRLWIHQLCAQISPLHDALESPCTTLKLSSIMSDSTYWEWYCLLYIVRLVKHIGKFILRFIKWSIGTWNPPKSKFSLVSVGRLQICTQISKAMQYLIWRLISVKLYTWRPKSTSMQMHKSILEGTLTIYSKCHNGGQLAHLYHLCNLPVLKMSAHTGIHTWRNLGYT